MTQPDGIHTIPVPPGFSPEQAWETIARRVPLNVSCRVTWAQIRVEDGRLVELLDRDAAEDDR